MSGGLRARSCSICSPSYFFFLFLFASSLFAPVYSTLSKSYSLTKRASHSEHHSRSSALDKKEDMSSNLSRRDDCIDPNPANTITDRLNIALNSSGDGYVLSLCPGEQYILQAPILFAFPNQEISTVGYPTDDTRATLVVDGPVSDGTGHTTAVDGTCATCSGVKLRNIQINGTRLGASPTNGGANIEFGGANSGQLIEYVHSFDPRSWSCLHVAEGGLLCNNATVQNNDIGPCGSDDFQQWADGISVACANSLVQNNMINNPTDGGIVLFGAPGTLVQNNTIWVQNHTLLGGINMVDIDPWSGNYTGTEVRNNTIMGGFATDNDEATQTDGTNADDVIIKLGIAIGPRTWFGETYGGNFSFSGYVHDNQLTGAFGYGIAITSARNFTIENNDLIGNTTFIGSRGPNCTTDETTPSPAPFVIWSSNVTDSTIQSDFTGIADGDGLTCILPPDGGDFWPYGGNPASSPTSSSSPSNSTSTSVSGGGGSSAGVKAGIALGVIFGVAAAAVAAYLIRRWALKRHAAAGTAQWNTASYEQNKY